MDGYVTSYEKNRFLVENERFRARGDSNDLYKHVLSICLIKDCIYNKVELLSAKMSPRSSEIRENFAW